MRGRKTGLLAMVPQTPPHGGVAGQAAVLLESRAFQETFLIRTIRTNSKRRTENPDGKVMDCRSLGKAFDLALAAFRAVLAGGYSAVYCVVNGDISFIWIVLCALFAARLRRCPLILHVHASRNGFWEWQKRSGAERRASEGRLRRIAGGIGDGLVAWLSRRADRVIHLTQGIDSHYAARGWRPADLVLPNSSELPSSIDTFGREPKSMLFLGRLSQDKGFFDLLDALARLDREAVGWKLHAAGTVPAGEDPGEIDMAIASRGLGDRVVLHGHVGGADKDALLAGSSILVHPTRRDVFPMAVVEAMGYGMAVIATGVGEIPEIPPDRGWVEATAGDPASIGEAISGLLSDPAVVAEMGAANRGKALEEYEIGLNSLKVVELIIDAVHEAGR